jgi:hypothetical protein
MRILQPAILLLAGLVAGCAENQFVGHLFYMTPYKYQELSCVELKQRAAAAKQKIDQMDRLREKADASTAGPVINTVVYGPDYSRARWDQRLYEEEVARKNCDPPPPLPPPN